MSDQVGNPEDRFSRVEAQILGEIEEVIITKLNAECCLFERDLFERDTTWLYVFVDDFCC